ncbi:hypothetical protein R991_004588, partial [Salmonella enterica]|nr:hypothetical protein [Salmonella enterica]
VWFKKWFGEAPLTPWDELWCGDGYSAEDIDHMWDAWKGSRAAIEIEMPEPFQMAKSSSGLTYYYESEVDDAIRAAGIKVKE